MRYTDRPRSGPVVILGDSLAAAYELPAEQGFVALLSERLGTEIVNLGVSGQTTGSSLERLADEVLPLQPSLVILQLGGNDALQKIDREITESNLEAMVHRLHDERIPILVLGIRGGVVSDSYASMYRDLVRREGLGYVPNILEGILSNPSLRIDHIHPNAAGHERIADRVEPELRRLLERIEKL